jgi:hypothetical protein
MTAYLQERVMCVALVGGWCSKCEAHKVWITGSGKPGDDTLYMFYTADSCDGRGIALLTSKPVE